METILFNTSPSLELAVENQQASNPHSKMLEPAPEADGMHLSRSGPCPPQVPEQLPCPRCDSTNTKFCYYNNYNLSQPRHFCKSCRRYWTRGGALRNVPVGGGTRKDASASPSNKRPRTTAATTKKSDNFVSPSSDNGATGRDQTLEPDLGLGSGSKEARPGSISCSWSNGQMGLGGGLLPFDGCDMGLRPDLGYEQAALDWPMEQVGGGDGGAVVVPGEFSDCSTWQMCGGGERGVAEGDYFSWSDLAISTPAKALE